ncbi:bifunctional oligoribonuclease/PAP phosphatase NrnA [Tsukamurella sp. 8F]|uniref:DHH family phosphoesterase n=1 Tax=unclassified Tsukamurella TaxID=2633480 RepID=UPI0023BA2431|nr:MULTISPECIES: bifunctional oligoribonuclease/PAP phosphatase NrnA [unclassified Tsukamurella]MDF0532035.1 bifunctional oligoribonuclease/PAP phosphatase NrnA [Tsukamurella sp. 8J]MDF0587534.1 bifunctional oligoribonuclease/PAP phosphatase NrnA [Tsukamurella sp. 8F]
MPDADVDTALVAVADALRSADSVAIMCHQRPDADTTGSALALRRTLGRLGIDASVSAPDGVPLPPALASLPGAEAFGAPRAGAAVAVAVDCASAERLGDLQLAFEAAPVRLVIDHHRSNVGFGTVDVVDPTANCTTELILRLADALGVEPDQPTADCLYAGLVTDTGSFRWSNPDGHAIASRLLAAGAKGAELARTLLDSHPMGWLRLTARVLASATEVPSAFGGRGVVYSVCTADDLGDLPWDAAESLIDLLRTVDSAEVAALFKEGEPGRWSASLRAKADVDVSEFARGFGGGGHRLASGYSADGDADEVVRAFLARV